MTIRQDIEASTNRPIAVGAVYAALDRLETKGHIKSRAGETTRGRGSRSKTYYNFTALGKRTVQQTRSIFRSMEKGTEAILGTLRT